MLRKALSISLLACVLLALVPPLAAQEVMVGARAGVTVGTISSDDSDFDPGNRTGFLAGAFASFAISDMFAIQPEILFAQKGFSEEDAGDKLTAELDYFEIPVLFKVMIPIEDSPVHPGVFVGGVVSFESSCSVSGESEGVSVSVDCDEFELEREKTDFGLVFGADLMVEMGENLFIIADGRYDLGLRDLEPDESSSNKSRTWAFSAGVGFKVN